MSSPETSPKHLESDNSPRPQHVTHETYDENRDPDPYAHLFESSSPEDGSQPFEDMDVGEDVKESPQQEKISRKKLEDAAFENLPPGLRQILKKKKEKPPVDFGSSPPNKELSRDILKRIHHEKKPEEKPWVSLKHRGVLLVGDEIPIFVRERYSPSPHKVPQPPNNYDGPLRFGSRVEFRIPWWKRTTKRELGPYRSAPLPPKRTLDDEDRDRFPQYRTIVALKGRRASEIGKGVIIGFGDSEFQIQGEDGREYWVAFDDVYIKEIPQKKRGIPVKEQIPSIEELMAKEVTLDLRQLVRDQLFELFSSIIPETKTLEKHEPSHFTNEELMIYRQGIKPWTTAKIRKGKNRWVVEWEFEGKKFSESFPLSFFNQKEIELRAKAFAADSYYAENFQNWMYAQKYESLEKQVPSEGLEIMAKMIAHGLASPNKIIEGLMNRYGNDIFHLNGLEFKNRLANNRGGVEIIDVELQRAFERMDYAKLENLKGRDLAVEVSRVVQEYIQRYPPNIDWIRATVKRRWIWSNFQKIKPSESDKQLFEQENLGTLKKLYAEHLKRYLWVRKKVQKQEIPDVNENIRDSNYPEISQKGYQLLMDVEEFERDCYTSRGGEESIAFFYLTRVLQPIIFLTGILGKYTHFFRNKISTGGYRVSALYAADLAYTFPELAMNFNALSDSEWENAISEIGRITVREVRNTLELINTIRHPGVRRKATKPHGLTLAWPKYIVNITDKCRKDTNSGVRYVRNKSGEVEYQKVNVAPFRAAPKYKMEPIIEPIPLGDIVICYDKSSQLFTCHSIEEVLRAIKRKPRGPINPYTGKKYPEDFVEKMTLRYAEEIKQLGATPPPPKAPWTPAPSPIKETEIEEISSEEEKEVDTIEELTDVLPDNSLSILYFCTAWKKPCQKFEEDFEQLKMEYPNINFVKIDFDDAREIADHYSVRKIPSFVFVRKNGPKLSKEGYISTIDKKKVIDAINKTFSSAELDIF